MNRNPILCALLVLPLAFGGTAYAQAGRDDQRHGDGRNTSHRARAHPPQQHRAPPRDERGAGPDHEFHRGDRLPAEYRNRTYVVDDWRGHHLSAPPRGYHWVQTGGDYVLAAVATGVILQLLLNH
ncbi:MAG TPA: RcnB family protein [Ramlibacter sp.]|uniref:RcnB family protein n=1 Tax=Ramlibacter sp. TaxID=1917967 RepID=UPI002CF08096|nr:RcnB family protein [Ramlibacter sp.]HVZ45703.1 RcnB family protein [Ramlibacter sp.]